MNPVYYGSANRYRKSQLVSAAESILRGEERAPSGKEMKDAQVTAVLNGDEYALALWSQIRWQWLVSNGKADIVLERQEGRQ